MLKMHRQLYEIMVNRAAVQAGSTFWASHPIAQGELCSPSTVANLGPAIEKHEGLNHDTNSHVYFHIDGLTQHDIGTIVERVLDPAGGITEDRLAAVLAVPMESAYQQSLRAGDPRLQHHFLRRSWMLLPTAVIFLAFLGDARSPLPAATEAASATGSTVCCAADTLRRRVHLESVRRAVSAPGGDAQRLRDSLSLPFVSASDVALVLDGETCRLAAEAVREQRPPAYRGALVPVTVVRVGTDRFVVDDGTYAGEFRVLHVFTSGWTYIGSFT